MTRIFYRWLIAALLLLCASGVFWCVLHYFFAGHDEFGGTANPAEPALLRIHGIAAIVTVFLLGGVATGHVVAGWKHVRNRPSGLTLAGAGVVLIVSGYALYYVTLDSARDAIAIAHEAVGVLAIAVAAWHWTRTRNVD